MKASFSIIISRHISATPLMASNSLMWFRKGLRIHDNPALEYARKDSNRLYPVFILDPHYLDPDPTAFSPGSALTGLNRIQFLLESLADLDSSLRKLGSLLLLLKGEPVEVLIGLLEKDYASASRIEVFSPVSHTLFDPADIIEKIGGRPPLSYQSFLKLAGQPSPPLSTTVSWLPPVENIGDKRH